MILSNTTHLTTKLSEELTAHKTQIEALPKELAKQRTSALQTIDEKLEKLNPKQKSVIQLVAD